MLHARCLVAAWLAASVWVAAQVPSRTDTFQFEKGSQVVIHVGKAGAFGFASHEHVVAAPVTGSITVDASEPTRSSVTLEAASASLRVTGEGEPAKDVPEVQRVMLSERVLDAGRYPTIAFRSRRVSSKGRVGDELSLSVEGELTLHGTTKPCVVAVRVKLNGGSLTAQGTTTITQSEFGIQPVTAAGGTVRVKDVLDVTFAIRAGR
jgi:polyisoprenoid-binding protein YceI